MACNTKECLLAYASDVDKVDPVRHFFYKLFDTSDFPARWHCGNWDSFHGWLHIGSDIAVWAAYFTIPIILLYFVLRRRHEVPFPGIFCLFGAFILACGTGHLVEASIFWMPIYRISALVKLFTALVSWGTVIALINIAPQALALRTSQGLEAELEEKRQNEAKLQGMIEELEIFNKLSIDREHQMILLKQEVNRLSKELGKMPPYDLTGLTTPPTS